MDCEHPDCTPEPRQAFESTRLCGLHLRGLQADVGDIAHVLDLIATSADELIGVVGTSDGVRTVPRSKPPMNLSMVNALTGRCRETVCGWAATVVNTSRDLEPFEAARILNLNTLGLASHPAICEIVKEIHIAANDCREVIPDERWNSEDDDNRPRPAGRCRQADPRDGTRDCHGPLLWIPGTLVVRCQRCHHEEQPDGWLEKRQILGPFGLSRSTLNRWIATGKVGFSGKYVCVDDVRAMVKKMRHADASELG